MTSPITQPASQRYATALLSLAVVLTTAFIALPDFGLISVFQFLVLALGAVITYAVPVLPAGWRGAFKTGAAVAAAVLTAVIPLVSETWNAQTIAVVVLVGVNALANHLGDKIRLDVTPKGA